jgi:hypothetical protein
MVECVVCRYWSERLEETRTHGRGKSSLEQQRRLMAALRTHQAGACACRFPDLLSDLATQEPELPGNALSFCDPARVRILGDSPSDELGVLLTFGWQ